MKEITQEGPNQWAVWDGWKLIGVYDSKLEALDAKIGWDRRLWPWTSLFDIEQRAATYAQKKKEAGRYD
ncbi:hypothetical protein [uncultured Dubosiella sp.]|uniref:hypothetical protein n=1 Tax=uncultured Dubosiella sp. TaxID=1937011 RepID=UPI0025B4935B|nr:hypothetical protein [uncultured Dubosiella sp.]